MSTPIKLKVTQAGIMEYFDAEANGFNLTISKLKYSTANFASVPGDTRTILPDVVAETPIMASATTVVDNSIRFVTLISTIQELAIASVGVYTSTGVLFAVASVETGTLFKVYPGISFTATFGIALNPQMLDQIEVVLDPDAALAFAMMVNHEAKVDPHPQYAKNTQLSQLSLSLSQAITDSMNAHLLAEDPHPQYALHSDLESLGLAVSQAYPRVVAAGVVTGGLNVVDLTANAMISTLLDYTKYGIFISPEAGHEAWNVTRAEKNFEIWVRNRSGTSRIGYNADGKTSWQVVQFKA